MENLKRMVVFSRVVEMGSFSGAARRLGIAKSAVSKHVSQLEQSVGVRLLNRNTRSLSLTDIGEDYFKSCIKMIEAAEEAELCVSSAQDAPRGLLKVSSPVSFGADHIAPLLNEFLQTHQSLKAELLLDDKVVDMTDEGIDIAIRVGWLPDSSLRAKKLMDTPRLLCASPEYLERNGIPETPEELAQHEWIIFSLLPTPYQYKLTKQNNTRTIQVKGRIKTNNANAVRTLLLEGAGVSALSDFLISEDLKEGKLVQLLPDYRIADASVYAVYQEQILRQSKIRLFVDFLASRL